MIAHFIDVGQADATLLEFSDETDSYTMLIDTGNWNATDVVYYLHDEKITSIDIIAITHPHADHIGQLDKIINAFDVHEVWMNGQSAESDVFLRALDSIEDNGVDYYEPEVGEIFDVGPLEITILHPSSLSGSTNNNSLSMRMKYGNVAFLFTGDGEEQAERDMLASSTNLKADILHVGHHGSNTSTTEGFLSAVNPEIAIYSAGNENQYEHPHEEVVNRLNAHKVLLYGTNKHGTIRVETDGVNYTVQTDKDGTIPRDSSDAIEKSDAVSDSSCININEADDADIQNIVHIGAERAALLIKGRPYESIDDLKRINGIGPARINDIKEQNIACIGG
ncbi:MBL fold metallo-hydrolase [Sporosarcina sp. Marseille-Q4063]|nr:MBL fold metallo-hydrolase [Sporosarcina sp. Marseille-Q4063]